MKSSLLTFDPRRTAPPHRRAMGSLLVVTALMAACGGGSGGADATTATAANVDAPEARALKRRAPAPTPAPTAAPAPIAAPAMPTATSTPTAAPAPAAAATPASDWTTIAAEGSSFVVQGSQTVRYGAGTSWVTKAITSSGQCTNEFFGTDPLFGTVKACQVAAVASAPAPIGAAPSHLKFFGFYLVNTGIDDPTDGIAKTNYTDEVSNFTNLNQYSVYYAEQDIRSDLNAMVAACTKPFLSIQEILWYRVDGNAPSGNRYVLYADWRDRWATFKARNGTVLNASRIGAIYLLDEPTWNGVPFDDLDLVSQTLKADIPTVPILLIEAYPVLAQLRVPVTVDWIGFDRYNIFDPASSETYLRDLATLKSRRSNNQRIMIVSDTQWLPYYEIELGQTPQMMGATFDSYYRLAASDPDVIGVLGYLWPGGFGDPKALGARNLPASAQAVLVKQGELIKANYSPCRDDR